MSGETPAAVAAQSIRRLTIAVVDARSRRAANPDVSTLIENLADRLEAVARDPADCVGGMEPTLHEPLERSPVSGSMNPVAAPVRFETAADGSRRSTVTFGPQYQGPPRFLHGGVTALVLDVAMAGATVVAGHPGVTAEMTIHYRRPVPVREAVTIRGRHIRSEGRKSWAEGTIEVDGEVAVACEGLFIERRAK